MGKIKGFTEGGDPWVPVLEEQAKLFGFPLPEEVRETREWLEKIGVLKFGGRTMPVNITITYLGKTVEMCVDFDDEKLVDGRSFNKEVVEHDFFDNVKIEVNVVN